MQGFKIFTHDWRSPLQGGYPLLHDDVQLPFILPTVEVDTSSQECGKGWNFCRSIQDAAAIAGFWSTGRPSKIVLVTALDQVYERGQKIRTSKLEITRLATDEEIQDSMLVLSSWSKNSQHLADEQWKWYVALGSPAHNKKIVQQSLHEALLYRGLTDWQPKEYRTARAARVARAAWAPRDAWDAWVAQAALDAQDAWVARDAWDARDAWATWAAQDAWVALVMTSAVKNSWLSSYKSDHLTRGIRDAYFNGLAIAIPTGPQELGWVMS